MSETNFKCFGKDTFNGAEIPIVFYYPNEKGHAELVKSGSVSRCVIGALSHVRKGRSLCFNVDSDRLSGWQNVSGFTKSLRPDFEYFLSCGIPGKMEGERYKKAPGTVKKNQ